MWTHRSPESGGEGHGELRARLPLAYMVVLCEAQRHLQETTCTGVLVWAAKPRLDFSSHLSRALPALPRAAPEGYDEFVFSYLKSEGCQNILLKRDLVSKYPTSDSMGHN